MEQYSRFFVFIIIFCLIAIWEITSPKSKLTQSKIIRWSNNLLLIALNTTLVEYLLFISSFGLALLVESKKIGLFSFLNLPTIVEIILGIILLDLVIYLQHVVFHKINFLWRIHRTHHADLDYDVTTALRFHPIEILLSMLIKFLFILIIGISPLTILLFEMILNGMAMFNHGNINLPVKVEQFLRIFIVTPDMHRVHHSIVPDETNSNFGFNLSLWDKLFNTYKKNASVPNDEIKIGLPIFRNSKYLKLYWILLIPFLTMKKND